MRPPEYVFRQLKLNDGAVISLHDFGSILSQARDTLDTVHGSQLSNFLCTQQMYISRAIRCRVPCSSSQSRYSAYC